MNIKEKTNSTNQQIITTNSLWEPNNNLREKSNERYIAQMRTCLMTSLRPGQSPPQVTMAALTSSGLKYISSRGPAR